MNAVQNPGKVIVVTDGTSSLTPQMGQEYGVHVVPLYVMFGTQTYRDGVDLDADKFYNLLRNSKQLPTTSQPTAEDFVQAYTSIWERLPSTEGMSIVSIHGSVKMTATVNSARAAAIRLPEIPIQVIDSQSISMGLGLMAIAAARASAAGQDAESIVQLVEGLIDKMDIYFTVETLEYLHKGGRIGGATAMIGSLLSIKPVLCVADGRVEPCEKPRSRRRAIGRVLDLVAEAVGDAQAVHAAVLHCDAPEDGQMVADQVAERFHPVELIIAETGPAIGVHGGPGTVGVAFYVE
jgi:DegV family protein with EDD domain